VKESGASDHFEIGRTDYSAIEVTEPCGPGPPERIESLSKGWPGHDYRRSRAKRGRLAFPGGSGLSAPTKPECHGRFGSATPRPGRPCRRKSPQSLQGAGRTSLRSGFFLVARKSCMAPSPQSLNNLCGRSQSGPTPQILSQIFRI